MIFILVIIFLVLFLVAIFAYQNINLKSDNVSDLHITSTNSEIQNIIRSGLQNINITKPDFQKIKSSINKDIFGMDNVINAIIIGLITKNHILISGYPGLAKTSIIKKFTNIIGLKSGRIQGTIDIQPNDIIGNNIYNPSTNIIQTKLGPINNNIVLVDEINRMTPKSQSALLQAMAENTITIDDKCYDLPNPFMVLATMNPHDDYGTFPMSAANLDRFALGIYIDYPNEEIEKKIINHKTVLEDKFYNLTELNIDKIYQEISNLDISDDCQNIILKIISNSRKSTDIKTPIGPRGGIYLSLVAKAIAWLEGTEVSEKNIYMAINVVIQHRITVKDDINKTDAIYNLL